MITTAPYRERSAPGDMTIAIIHKLARSYGYKIPAVTGSVVRQRGKNPAWRIFQLFRLDDGTPGPDVTVRLVQGKWIWERTL